MREDDVEDVTLVPAEEDTATREGVVLTCWNYDCDLQDGDMSANLWSGDKWVTIAPSTPAPPAPSERQYNLFEEGITWRGCSTPKEEKGFSFEEHILDEAFQESVEAAPSSASLVDFLGYDPYDPDQAMTPLELAPYE